MGNNSNHNNNNNYNNNSNKGSGGSNDNYVLPPSKNNLGEVEVSASRIQNTEGRFIPNGTLGDMINTLYNNAQLALVPGSGYKEMVAAALKKGGKNYYYIFSQKGSTRNECSWNISALLSKGYHLIFSMHTHSGDPGYFVGPTDHDAQISSKADVFSIDAYGNIWNTFVTPHGLPGSESYGKEVTDLNGYQNYFNTNYGIKR